EPECECRFTGDMADASGCPAHGPNARRLAAIPDLLATLKEIVAITDRKHDAWDRARAAIAAMSLNYFNPDGLPVKERHFDGYEEAQTFATWRRQDCNRVLVSREGQGWIVEWQYEPQKETQR